MLFCMSMVAFADGQAYNVVTSYDGTNVEVTTTVTGANANDEVAFLVEKGSDIIWIDQKTADGEGAASSVFTALATAAEGAKVKVGSTSYAASTFTATQDTVVLPNYTVTWNIANGSEYTRVVAVANTESEEGPVTTKNSVTFYVFPAAGEELVSYTRAGEVVTDIINKNVIVENVTADTAFTFTFGTKAAPTVDPEIPSCYPEAADTEAATPTAVVTATANNATDFGILVAADGYDFSKIESLDGLSTTSDTVRKYHAVGANSLGQFVIKLVDDTGAFFTDGANYDACVYAFGTKLELGEVFDLNN